MTVVPSHVDDYEPPCHHPGSTLFLVDGALLKALATIGSVAGDVAACVEGHLE